MCAAERVRVCVHERARACACGRVGLGRAGVCVGVGVCDVRYDRFFRDLMTKAQLTDECVMSPCGAFGLAPRFARLVITAVE